MKGAGDIVGGVSTIALTAAAVALAVGTGGTSLLAFSGAAFVFAGKAAVAEIAIGGAEFVYGSLTGDEALATEGVSDVLSGGLKKISAGKGNEKVDKLKETWTLSNKTPSEISKMSPTELRESLPDGWTYSESPDGRFLHNKDSNGNYKIRIDPPDAVTSYPHVHIFDSNGNALDINGKIVPRTSPDAHIPR